MADVSAVLSIDTIIPTIVAGREAGLSGKPPHAPIRKRLSADGDDDHHSVDGRCRASPLSVVFVFFSPVVGLLATARSLRKVLRRYLIFRVKALSNQF